MNNAFRIFSKYVFLIIVLFNASKALAVPNGAGSEIFNGNVGIGTTIFSGAGLTVMNGNVGIGTWKPINAMDINGNIQVGVGVYWGGLNSAYLGSLGFGTSAGVSVARINGNTRGVVISPTVSTETWAVYVDTNTNVGMGTFQTKAKLSIAGNLGIGTFGSQYLTLSPPQNGMFVQGNVGIGTFGPVNGQLIVSTASGNVGIGSYAPGVPLDILAADNATAQRIIINAASASVTSTDTFIDFDSTAGSIGSIAGTGVAGVIAYNTFTGSHWTQVIDREHLFDLALLCSTGERVDWEQGQLTKTRVCQQNQDQSVIGAYGGVDKKNRDLVLAIGTGYVIVENTGEDLNVGDYLTTSTSLGLARKQDVNVYKNYTVAKIMEPVHWKPQEISRKVAVIYEGG